MTIIGKVIFSLICILDENLIAVGVVFHISSQNGKCRLTREVGTDWKVLFTAYVLKQRLKRRLRIAIN